jgi:iron complex outermembrane recepter protein
MKRYILFFLAGLIGLALSAQVKINIRGKVVDPADQRGVPHAVVQINATAVYAGDEGEFSAELPVADRYRLFIDQIGYRPYEQWLEAAPAGPLRIELAAQPLLIEEILITDRPRQSAPQGEVRHDAARAVRQPRDIGELLRATPGFGIIRRGGYALDPVFRAFKYEQLNLIYDGGVQLTHACPNRMDPASTHVAPDEIEKIELIRGPFSVRYGPAMGATVNLVTQPPRLPANGHVIGGKADAGYESNGDGRLTRLALFGGSRRLDFHLNGGWKDFGDYTTGAGKTVPSSFRAYDYALKSGLNLSAHERLQFHWRQAFSRDILHAALPMDTDVDNTSVASLDYRRRRPGATLYGIDAKLYGSRVDHTMSNTRRPNFMMTEAVSTVAAETYGGKVELNWLPGRRFIVYTGADARYVGRAGDRVRTVKRNMMTGEPLPMPMVMTDNVWQDASLFTAGLFAEARWLPSEHWTVGGGLRADLAGSRIGDPASDFLALYGELPPRTELLVGGNLSATWRPADPWSIQLALGRGARPANLIERSINHFTVGPDPHEYVGDPRLRAEANHQAELSLSHRGEHHELSISAFYAYITDYITAAVDSTLPRKYMPMTPPRFARRFVNIDAATQAGFEFSARYHFWRRFEAYGTLAYTRAHNLDWDEPLAEITPLEGAIGLKYERPRWWLDARGRFVDGQDRFSPSFGETATPGFTTYDMRAGVKPLPGLSVGLAVLNVFDRAYREHLNRAFTNLPETGVLLEPGRSGSVFVSFEF